MNHKTTFFYLLFVYTISTAIGFLWLGFTDIAYVLGNSGYTVITPDGYYYLNIIEKILNNTPTENIGIQVSVFCYLFALPLKLIGINEAKDVLFFVPPFFAGLFGVAAFLFAKEFLDDKRSLLAALLASSSIGLVVRMKAGYFDTDIFALTLPFFVLAFGLRYLRTEGQKELVAATVLGAFLALVYSNGSILLLLCIVGFGVLFFDKFQERPLLKRLTLWLFVTSLLNPLYILDMLSKLQLYLFKEESSTPDLVYNSNFGFIAESSNIPFFDAINLVSGSIILFVPSLIGLYLLFRQKREIVVILPFLLLGSAAFVLGSRFAPFAAIAAATGLIFFASWMASKTQKRYLQILVFICIFVPMFVVNLLNAAIDNGIGGFHAKEISSLAKIKPLVEKNSTVFSRWDYGYELRYYLEAFTPSNNGSMGGAQIFVESAALSSTNQNFAANLILEAEAQLRQPVPKDDKNSSTLLVKMAGQKGFDTAYISGYLNYLEQNRSNPCKNTYLLIPTRMTDIFETIQKNANAEFMKGRINPTPFFKFYRAIAEDEKTLKLDSFVYLDKTAKMLSIKNKKTELCSIFVVKKEDGVTDIFENKLNDKEGMVLIFLQELNGYILSDKKSIETLFVQMSIFDKYDKTRFEKIYDDRYFKLFRVL